MDAHLAATDWLGAGVGDQDTHAPSAVRWQRLAPAKRLRQFLDVALHIGSKRAHLREEALAVVRQALQAELDGVAPKFAGELIHLALGRQPDLADAESAIRAGGARVGVDG